MPSRAYASLLLKKSLITYLTNIHLVSMPSRAVTSFLHGDEIDLMYDDLSPCQCPLGLLPHFYKKYGAPSLKVNSVSMPSRAVTSFLQERYVIEKVVESCSVNALSGCYLISTLYL